jgi:hypothetical protein
MNLRNLVPVSGRSHNLSYFTPTNIADRVHDLLDGFFAEAQLMPTFDSFKKNCCQNVAFYIKKYRKIGLTLANFCFSV